MMFNHSPIQMEWFYYLYGEKTKLNWFLMEFALEYYDHIMDSPKLKDYRIQYNKEQIAQYCTYFTRRFKESVLKCLRGKRKSVIFYDEHISDFYPHFTDPQVRQLCHVASYAWKELVNNCLACPEQCYRDYESRSYNFEKLKD